MFWHSVWKACDSPNDGAVASIRRRTRALYHKAIKKCKNEKERLISESIAESLVKTDYHSFWAEVRKKTSYKSNTPSSIDGVNCPGDIANHFAIKYSELYTSAPYDSIRMDQINGSIDSLIESRCCSGKCDSNHKISYEDVVKGLQKLKNNKSDGNEGLTSNHIKNGSKLLHEKLATLCSLMLCHGYCSPNLRLSTIIPIVKNKKASLNDSSNYRAIALSSIITKLLDIIILQKNSKALHSSDLQF